MGEALLPAIAGLATGVALVLAFSIFSAQHADHEGVEISTVTIPKYASIESNAPSFVPEVIKVKIGANNTIRWVNQDSVPHSVTTDNNYRDPYSGLFDSRKQLDAGFIMPGGFFEFTFNEAVGYPYHGEPHPWMQGMVIVVP